MTPGEAEATRSYIAALRDSAKQYGKWTREGGRMALYYAKERDRCMGLIEWYEISVKEYGNGEPKQCSCETIAIGAGTQSTAGSDRAPFRVGSGRPDASRHA